MRNDIHDSEDPEMKKMSFVKSLFVLLLLCVFLCGAAAAEGGEAQASAENLPAPSGEVVTGGTKTAPS